MVLLWPQFVFHLVLKVVDEQKVSRVEKLGSLGSSPGRCRAQRALGYQGPFFRYVETASTPLHAPPPPSSLAFALDILQWLALCCFYSGGLFAA